VYDDDRVSVEANSVSASILDKDTKEVLNVLETVRENAGIYSATVDTTSLGLSEGTYIMEFSCIANGQNKSLRDFLKVKYTL
jgi:hypothetical protein